MDVAEVGLESPAIGSRVDNLVALEFPGRHRELDARSKDGFRISAEFLEGRGIHRRGTQEIHREPDSGVRQGRDVAGALQLREPVRHRGPGGSPDIRHADQEAGRAPGETECALVAELEEVVLGVGPDHGQRRIDDHVSRRVRVAEDQDVGLGRRRPVGPRGQLLGTSDAGAGEGEDQNRTSPDQDRTKMYSEAHAEPIIADTLSRGTGGKFMVFSSAVDNGTSDGTVVQPQW